MRHEHLEARLSALAGTRRYRRVATAAVMVPSYMRELRLAWAADQLARSKRSVAAVAFEAGRAASHTPFARGPAPHPAHSAHPARIPPAISE